MVAVLQRGGGADDTARRISDTARYFSSPLFGYSILGKAMGQQDQLYRTTDSVALVWHDQE